MSAPVVNGGPPQNPMGSVDLNGILSALGNGAEVCARKGAGAADGVEAKDFAAAALAYTQAIVALMTPPNPPQNGQPSPNGAQAQT